MPVTAKIVADDRVGSGPRRPDGGAKRMALWHIPTNGKRRYRESMQVVETRDFEDDLLADTKFDNVGFELESTCDDLYHAKIIGPQASDSERKRTERDAAHAP